MLLNTKKADPSSRAVPKEWVCGRSLAGIVGSNHAGAWMCMSLVSVVCCVGLITRLEKFY